MATVRVGATIARLALGVGQMAGAVAGLLLMATEGLTGRLVAVAAGTTALTVASRVLFRRGSRRSHLG